MKMSINETRHIIDAVLRTLSEGYFSSPNRDGTFDDARHKNSRDMNTSIFETAIDANNVMTFRLINDPRVITRVLGMPDSYVPDEIAEKQNQYSPNVTGIKVVEDGILQKYGDKWEVKKKMIIRWI